MIIYSKTLWGLPLLTRIYGSALPRAIAPAVFSGLITMILLLLGDRVQHLWENPFAYQPFVLIVSFVLTFRSNLAYQRHWEALTQVQIMTSRWMDAAIQVIMFDKHPVEPVQPDQQQRLSPGAVSSSASAAASHHQFVSELVHLISLLHGLACAALRRDPDLANLTRHSRLSAAPPSDPALLLRTSLPDAAGDDQDDAASPRASVFRHWAAAGDVNIIGAANWRDIFMLRGSSSAISKYHAAQPLPIIGGVSKHEVAALGCRHDIDAEQAVGLCTEEEWGGVITGRYPGALHTHSKQRNNSSMAVANLSAGTFSSSRLWGFLRQRQQQQGQPQQPGVRQQMQQRSQPSFTEGTAGAAASIAGSAKSGKSANGGKSLMKRSLSRRFKISTNHACCTRHLPYMDRPMLVLAWVHELLLERQIQGGLRIPAPILARIHTCLSDGLVGFEQCRKLADTPFPFPWAQFVLLMLVIFTVTLPLLVLAYVAHSVLAVVVTVMTVSTYWAVNEVARDVEDPFLYEPNDMPLANSQYHVNELLLALSATERPASGMMPVLLPMTTAAATSGCSGGMSGLSHRVRSAAASASWPNLGHAATTGELDQSRRDAELVDSTTGLAAHGRLPTILSEEVGFLSCATRAAGGDSGAAATGLPESPFVAAELQRVVVAPVRPEQQGDQQENDPGPSKEQWQHVQRQTDQHSNNDSSIHRAQAGPSGAGGLDAETGTGALLDAAAKRPVRSSNGGSVGSFAGSAGVRSPVDQDTVSPRDNWEVVTAVEAAAAAAGGGGGGEMPTGFGRHSWSGAALSDNAYTGAAVPSALQRVSWRDSSGNRPIADIV